MLFYIRLLKPPRSTISGHPRTKTFTVSALVTITSDLGELFYPNQATLKCDLLLQTNNKTDTNNTDETSLVGSMKVTWSAGCRNVKIEMNAPIPLGDLSGKRDYELVLRVSSENPKPADNLLEYLPGFGAGILSAWSGPFEIPEPGIGSSSGGFVQRRLQLNNDVVLRVWEETGESIAKHIWDGGVALAAYLAQYHAFNNEGTLPLLQESLQQTKCLRVLELGSGCGIVGLALAALRETCHVLLTDLDSAEEICQWNIKCSQTHLQGNASFQIFDWDDPAPPATSPDIILIADCTYNPDSATSLVQAIHRCVNGSRETIIVLAHKKRHDSESLFFDLMGKHFQIVDHSEFNTLPVKGKLRNQDSGLGTGAEVVDLYTFKLLSG